MRDLKIKRLKHRNIERKRNCPLTFDNLLSVSDFVGLFPRALSLDEAIRPHAQHIAEDLLGVQSHLTAARSNDDPLWVAVVPQSEHVEIEEVTEDVHVGIHWVDDFHGEAAPFHERLATSGSVEELLWKLVHEPISW